ncbi:MAG: tRNA dihydrouridine synthase DusB [Candidatus Marinimicrobia bacterium]|nr:tRNA dihydrouridine synthase DusB [Candidatus Neomarinimicrobiota bacterium]
MMHIGNLHIDNPVFLAPMAGVTDHTFRVLCRGYGVGMVYTEFVSANGIVRESVKTLDMVRFTPDERPIGIQLFGEDAETISRSAAIMAERFQPDVIDLNFGCPVPKVTKKGAGSAMLRDLVLMRQVVAQTVAAVGQIPVTVKMRAGWDSNSIVAVEAAQIIEAEGAQAVALHPRTTKQSFGGKADWPLIAAVKEAVSIPVIGNGDILTAHDAQAMFEQTGCDAVMIARGALGRPWIFRQINELRAGAELTPVTISDVAAMCRTHFNLLAADKNERLAINLTKKHFGHYLKGFDGAVTWRKAFHATDSAGEVARLLDEFDRYCREHQEITLPLPGQTELHAA